MCIKQACNPPPLFFLKILQNDQLDEISPLGTEEVSAVSQAWFTTKEDKDSLTNKGKINCILDPNIRRPWWNK